LELDPEDIYIDDGNICCNHLWSRPAGRKMRETIYHERVGHVLALKMDRLVRDVQDCLGSVDELRGIGVDIHILDQDGGTLDTSTSMGRFFLTTIASLAELERGQISERTKIAMKHLKDNAKVFTGPIFGWDRQGAISFLIGGNRTPLTICDIDITSKDGQATKLQSISMKWE
jgi:DNA invertase Pin-like site-specific DNA recombinase